MNKHWRALAEQWEGGIEEIYRAILYKDDEHQKYILQETTQEGDHTTELSIYDARKWVLKHDASRWQEVRMEKEFPGEQLKAYLNASLHVDPEWRTIGDSFEGDDECYSSGRMFKDEKENRYFLETVTITQGYDVDEEEVGYMLVPIGESKTLVEMTEKEALDWMTGWGHSCLSYQELKNIFPAKMVDDVEKSFIESMQAHARHSAEAIKQMIISSRTLQAASDERTSSSKIDRIMQRLASHFKLRFGDPSSERVSSQQTKRGNDIHL